MSPRGLHLEHIATTPSERIANVLRAHASEDSDTADSVRWLGRNLQRARAALAELAAHGTGDVRAIAAAGLALADDE